MKSGLPDFNGTLYQMLLAAARDAVGLAYCPYSNFPVGAALLTYDGRIYKGANFETVTFTQTKHAEEVALLAAFSDEVFVRAQRAGVDRLHTFEALAVFVPKKLGLMPCGNCCATLAEVFRDQFIIAITGPGNADFEVVRFNALAPYLMHREDVLESARPES